MGRREVLLVLLCVVVVVVAVAVATGHTGFGGIPSACTGGIGPTPVPGCP